MIANRGVTPVSFPPTHWSLVTRAGVPDHEARRQALEELLVRYLPALRAHLVLGRRLQPSDADDVLQEFIAAKILERDLLGKADQQLGRFRTFLLTALDRFLLNRLRDQRAQKRCPQDGPAAELGEQADELPAFASPAEAFDAAWARSVITEALQRMQRECAPPGRRVVWDLFYCRVVAPALEGAEPPGYEDLVARFQLSSPSQASNVLVTAKRMYVRVLRAVVAEYTRNETDIDAEINELRTVLARGG